MSDLVEGFKILTGQYKHVGGKFLKGTALELFLEYYHDDLIESFTKALNTIPPEMVPELIKGGAALPIPIEFFQNLKGFEEYLETIEPGKIFEWIAEASPLHASAVMDLGKEGAGYMVKLKQFIMDSVRAAEELAEVQETTEVEKQEPAAEAEEPTPPPARLRTKVVESEPPPPPKVPKVPKAPKVAETPAPEMKTLTCDKCKESWEVTEEEALLVTECPFCHEPA
jgi:hypothetical protein